MSRGLDPKAYRELAPGESYPPYVPAARSDAEFTWKAVGFGIVFGIIFGAANAYLGLRAGLTISTSIPIAVMTVAVFRLLKGAGVGGTLLEANISQTTGSASSSVASGVIFTLPALFMWGVAPDLLQMTLLAMCGGVLGTLFMIPLRRFLIAREHGRLPYPEGTACAEVLVASEAGGNRARHIFAAIGVAALLKVLTGWAKLIPDHVTLKIPFLKKGEVGFDLSAALFGVGYILGLRVALIMVGGGLLSSLVIIPVIAYWGEAQTVPLYPETALLIKDMSAGQIWSRYVRYIGAGAVATAGIITLARSVPVMVESFRIGMTQLKGGKEAAAAVPRTDRDLPLSVIGIGVLIVFLVLGALPQAFAQVGEPAERLVAALCVILFSFFFVTVSSRIVGLVGVTSNPTSGMIIAALLGTATVFFLVGWTDTVGKVATLTVGCVVGIAASIAGDVSQDLKTGYLLGGTPREQQKAEIIGVLTSATFICLAVLLLAETFGFGTRELPAPQATLMKLVIDGVIDQALPWELVGIGAALAILCELVRIPSLPFAVGVYLPVATMTPVALGGILRWWLEKRAADDAEREGRRETGVLLGSGFVGGEGLLGVALAGTAFVLGRKPDGFGSAWAGSELLAMLAGAAAFALLTVWFVRRIRTQA